MLGQKQVRQPADLPVDEVHTLHLFEYGVFVLRGEDGATVREEHLDEVVQKLGVLLVVFEGERVDTWAVQTDAVHLAAVQLHHAFVAVADVEDESETVVLPLQRKHLVGLHGFSGPRWPDGELHPHTADVGVMEKRCSLPGLEDVQVFAVEVVRQGVADVGGEDRREAGVVILAQPEGEDVVSLVAGKHRVER